VMAKGVEDTAFYRWNRFVALNEVGGAPDRFGVSPAEFHAELAGRVAARPTTMTTLSTHDTKRSEDVRARLAVLSEMTTPWRDAVRRWIRINRRRKREVDGAAAPCSNDEYHFYQTLLGSWPLPEPDAAGLAEYRARLEGYMIKAVREAKVHTSWTETGTGYEDALLHFVRSVLEPRDNNLFLTDFLGFWRPVARFGLLNSLSQTLCKLTAPGVPDIYQGNELWDFSLVDPDNRRPVDYHRRGVLLAELQRQADDPPFENMLEHIEDGRCKLLLIWRALQLRHAQPQLFSHGDYRRLRVHGSRAQHLCAFMRRCERRALVVIVPRLYRRLLDDAARMPLGSAVWEDTFIELPGNTGSRRPLQSVLDGAQLQPMTAEGATGVSAAQALARFPVALLCTGDCSTDPRVPRS